MRLTLHFTMMFLLTAGVWQQSAAAIQQETGRYQSSTLSVGYVAATAGHTQENDSQKIRFQFQETEWKDVIPWFAEQAGFSLQPINDWPEGTFYLKDDSEYTVMQALDQLNHALRMRKPPFTLIRNRNMLILSKLEDANFPDDLIETVVPADLNQRGKYETITCIFDLGELDVQLMYEELKPMISSSNKNYFASFPAANQIRVRETGGTLRDIRDLIDTAKKRVTGDNQATAVYRLKHVDSETFMLIARGLLGMDPGRDSTNDGSLTISREPFGDRLFVRGTAKMQQRFKDTQAVIDVQAEAVDGVEVAKMNFKTYSIMVDPKLGFDLLQTVLEGSPARMQQDELTGSITVLGRVEDHEMVAAALAAVAGEYGEAFEIIKIESGDATEIMLAVQSLLRQTTTVDTGVTKGPVVMANSLLNQILVRGTPQEVAEVSRMVKQLDANSVPVEFGPRTGTRIINMGAREIDELTPMLDDLLNATGRTSRLNVVLPDQRKDIKSRLRGVPERVPTFDEIWNSGPAAMPPARRPAESPANEKDSKNSDEESSNSERSRSERNRQSLRNIGFEGFAIAANLLGVRPFVQISLLTVPASMRQDEARDVGQTSDENGPLKSSNYLPPPQLPSVPGAPIEARVTDFGIVLKSDDLDALDDLERVIRDRLGDQSEPQLPTFFFLKYRKAESLKNTLEQYFGLADTSGGGGGGGGLMGGMMNNMLGGGAGDLLGGLLGGGSSGGTGGAGELEGDVRFGMDVPFNAIYVAGATGNDLDQISELIDILDQPEAPHDLDTIGVFRTIDILYRDPEELKTLIEAQIPDYIDSGKAEAGGQQNNEAAQMMKMLQQLQGGGKGGGSDAEQEKPKARLGVDKTTKRLLVTGPDFIYQKILKIVLDLDRKELSDPLNYDMMKQPGDLASMMQTLNQLFPGKIELIEGPQKSDGTSSSGSSSSGSGSSTASTDAAAKAQQQQVEQARAAIQNAFRAQQQGGAGGGRGGRGGGGGGPGGGGGAQGGGGGGRGGFGGGGGGGRDN